MISSTGPTGIGQPGLTYGLPGTFTPSRLSLETPGFSPGTTVASAGTAAATGFGALVADFGQLLETAFPGLKNDKMLRMIIGLMILWLIMEQQGFGRGDSGGADRLLDNLGGCAGGGGRGSSFSAISVQIQQSSTIIVSGFSMASTGTAGSSQQSPGASLDAVG